MQLLHARRHAPVDLAEHDRAPPGVLDHTWLQVVRAEVDEAAHRARLADDRLDDQLVQTVLRGDDVAVGAEVRRERARRRFRVLRLDGEHDVGELAVEGVGGERRCPDAELRERTLDAKSRRVHRGDVLLRAVHERDLVARAGKVRPDGAADRAGPR